jgi:hypothetical protein
VPVLVTVATSVLLLFHVPPPVPSARLVVAPTQMPVLPVIGDIGFAETILVTTQAPPRE